MILIKVSDIQSLTDARYCAGMNVSFLSLVFDEVGKGKLNPTEFKAIEAWIEGVQWWGEYLGSDPAILKDLADSYGISTWVTNCHLEDDSIRIIGLEQTGRDGAEMSVAGDKTIGIKALYDSGISTLLLRNPENADEMLALHREFPDLVFNLSSGEEERPGWMDLSGLQDVLEALDEAN
jgi:phosphoribosylanthranilate isomerase